MEIIKLSEIEYQIYMKNYINSNLITWSNGVIDLYSMRADEVNHLIDEFMVQNYRFMYAKTFLPLISNEYFDYYFEHHSEIIRSAYKVLFLMQNDTIRFDNAQLQNFISCMMEDFYLSDLYLAQYPVPEYCEELQSFIRTFIGMIPEYVKNTLPNN